jgi:hypothetical protein
VIGRGGVSRVRLSHTRDNFLLQRKNPQGEQTGHPKLVKFNGCNAVLMPPDDCSPRRITYSVISRSHDSEHSLQGYAVLPRHQDDRDPRAGDAGRGEDAGPHAFAAGQLA